MTNTDLIKELRALTQAGMKDCKEALEEAAWDLQKAVDIVKTKGLNIADGRTGRVASEGRVVITEAVFDQNKVPLPNRDLKVMVEVNCQTDFVANSIGFIDFSNVVVATLLGAVIVDREFQPVDVEAPRQELVATTKENVVVRRWWAEESLDPTVKVFSYTHSNNKIGVLLSLQAPSKELVGAPEFLALGDDLVMQVAAMNPIAVSSERLSPEDLARQKAIFEAQLKELNKPQATWEKIVEGKFRKWFSEACLLEQESVIVPKTTVKQVIKNAGAKLGGEITVVNFIRCQVGEGIVKKQDNLAEEVSKLMVDQAYGPDVRK